MFQSCTSEVRGCVICRYDAWCRKIGCWLNIDKNAIQTRDRMIKSTVFLGAVVIMCMCVSVLVRCQGAGRCLRKIVVVLKRKVVRCMYIGYFKVPDDVKARHQLGVAQDGYQQYMNEFRSFHAGSIAL